MAFDTPVLFLVFNRPGTTQVVFDKIKEVKPKYLFVSADGPRLDKLGEKEKCEQVRGITANIDWDCELKTLFREENLGCGKAVSEAINWFFEHVEAGIIIEDDCLPDSTFFSFCEEMLEKYKSKEMIMHIGGHSLGVTDKTTKEQSYFFSAYNHIWGWATWRRAWKDYHFDIDKLNIDRLKENLSYYFSTEQEREFWFNQIETAKNIDTWDFQWTFSIWQKMGLSILPSVNLVRNIGFDSNATHTRSKRYLIESAPYGSYNSKDFINEKNEFQNNKIGDLEIFNNLFNGNASISPICKTGNISLIKTIYVDSLIEKYKRNFNIGVGKYFRNIEYVKIFECNESKYRFYYPFTIDGDGEFYEQLQNFDWYYMPWKWEHEQALKFIKPGMKVLEVGCGQGSFLAEVKRRLSDVSVTGLELNLNAVNNCQKLGLNVFSEFVQEFSTKANSSYDIVLSFQVLEHICDVYSFLKGKIDCLKPGGILIIGVPNNDSFSKYDSENDILNMPPHHMGCWNSESLSKLQNYFPISLISQKKEPLQAYHIDWFLNILEKKLQNKSRILFRIYHKINGRSTLKYFLLRFPSLVIGHTIFVAYRKL